MDRKYKVGGYVKLAKLWERSKDAAVAYHSSYYEFCLSNLTVPQDDPFVFLLFDFVTHLL